jgi:hypothetical protein
LVQAVGAAVAGSGREAAASSLTIITQVSGEVDAGGSTVLGSFAHDGAEF